MSREERRAYQRMMRGTEREPRLPPGARLRAERAAARRAQQRTTRTFGFDLRFWARSLVISAVLGLIGMSLQWESGMPFAGYVGAAVGLVALAIQVGIRLLQRRASPGDG